MLLGDGDAKSEEVRHAYQSMYVSLIPARPETNWIHMSMNLIRQLSVDLRLSIEDGNSTKARQGRAYKYTFQCTLAVQYTDLSRLYYFHS